MFNLIMRSFDWNNPSGVMPLGRVFEYTETAVEAQFRGAKDVPLLDRLAALPCLFMEEGNGDEIARVGHISKVRLINAGITFDFSVDTDVPPIQNRTIYANRALLNMPQDFEFTRNHWAVKDVDLYRFLLRTVRPRRQRPKVFHIEEHEQIQPSLVSAMMPFDAKFDAVYQSIKAASDEVRLRCRRADDIWENPSIIQDVVSLIDRSRIVVCDCTGRNPNVFYEAGIAHTLGREVILITQNEGDIPFDLRHLRYVKYLDNNEGREQLREALKSRMQYLLEQ